MLEEVRQFARNGSEFRTAPTGGFVLAGFFAGRVHVYSDRIDIVVDQATVRNASTDEPKELQSIKVELGRSQQGICGTRWATDAASPALAVRHTLKPGETYALSTPMRFTIRRDALAQIDEHWLVFDLQMEYGSSSAWCYAHADQYLLPRERVDLDRPREK